MRADTPQPESPVALVLEGALQRRREAYLAHPVPTADERKADLAQLERLLRDNTRAIVEAMSADFGHRSLRTLAPSGAALLRGADDRRDRLRSDHGGGDPGRPGRGRALDHDPRLLPAGVALDPLLTLGLPPAITAATGMDALTHAVGSWLSRLSFPRTEGWAVAATRLVLGNLEPAHRDGRDPAAREAMLVGSYLAGLSFTRAGVGYVHAFAHQLGALYHLPHGLANAILLPFVLDASRPDCERRLAELARRVNLTCEAGSDEALCDAFVARVRQLNEALSIPRTVAALRTEDFDRIIDAAFAEAHGTYGVPRYLDRREATALPDRLLPARDAEAAGG